MSLPLGEEELLADFDRRCNRGTIFYDNNPVIQTHTIDGFQVRENYLPTYLSTYRFWTTH